MNAIDQSSFKEIDRVFKNLHSLNLDYFRHPEKVIYLHSASLVDADVYPIFYRLLSEIESCYLTLVESPVRIGSKTVKVDRLPHAIDQFNSLIADTDLPYSGGIGYSDDMNMQMVSSPDVEVIAINLPNDIVIDDINLESEFILTRSQAIALVSDHILFLNQTSR